MNKLLTVFLSLCLFSHSTKATTPYKNFIIVDNVIWALTTDGSIQLIDAKTREFTPATVKNDSKIIVLVTDRHNNIVIADNAKTVKRYNQQQQVWEIIGTYTSVVIGLVFDKKITVIQLQE